MGFISDNYEEDILNQIEYIRNTKKPIVIFGVKASGLMCKSALDYLNIKLTCFCDNNPALYGTTIYGGKVLTPNEVAQKFPDAIVVVSALTNGSFIEIKEQISNLGLLEVFRKDPLIYTYQKEVLNRPIDFKLFSKALYQLNNEVSPCFVGVAAFITEKCNLKCRHCGYFVPYYKEPKHHNKERIIKSIAKIAEASEGIAMLTILGGETLLYPEEDLIEICDAAYKISNIILVRIITNGSVLPSDAMIKKLKDSLTHLNISDYCELSKNKNLLKDNLEKNNIIFDVSEMSKFWYQMSAPNGKIHSKEQMQNMFDSCSVEKDILHNGVLHYCEYSAVLYEKQWEKLEYSEVVDFTNDEITAEEYRSHIIAYQRRKKYLSACGYCRLDINTHVKPADQLKEAYIRIL